MSIRVSSIIWKSAPVGGSELLVLLALADHADETGNCYPSIAGLAEKVRLSPRRVQANIRRLENLGLVFCASKKGGAGQTNRYQICLQRLTSASPFGGEKGDGSDSVSPKKGDAGDTPEKGETVTHTAPLSEKRVTLAVKKGDAGDTRTVIEPSEVTAAATARARDPDDDPPPARSREFIDDVLDAAGIDLNRVSDPSRWFGSEPRWAIGRWLADPPDGLGLSEPEVLEVIREKTPVARGRSPPKKLGYFDEPMAEAAGRKAAPPLQPINGSAHDRPPSRRETAKDRAEQEAAEDRRFLSGLA